MITWQNATEGSTEIETGDYVTINGTNYPVKTKKTSSTPLSAENLNTNQANLIDFTQLSNGSYKPTENKLISLEGIYGSDTIINGTTATTPNLYTYSAGGNIQSVGNTFTNLGSSMNFEVKRGNAVVVCLHIGGLYISNTGYSIQAQILADNSTTSNTGVLFISPRLAW